MKKVSDFCLSALLVPWGSALSSRAFVPTRTRCSTAPTTPRAILRNFNAVFAPVSRTGGTITIERAMRLSQAAPGSTGFRPRRHPGAPGRHHRHRRNPTDRGRLGTVRNLRPTPRPSIPRPQGSQADLDGATVNDGVRSSAQPENLGGARWELPRGWNGPTPFAGARTRSSIHQGALPARTGARHRAAAPLSPSRKRTGRMSAASGRTSLSRPTSLSPTPSTSSSRQLNPRRAARRRGSTKREALARPAATRTKLPLLGGRPTIAAKHHLSKQPDLVNIINLLEGSRR